MLPIFGKGNLDDGFEVYPCGGALRFQLKSSAKDGETVKFIRLVALRNESTLKEFELWGSFKLKLTAENSVIMDMEPLTGGTYGSGHSAVTLQMPQGFTLTSDPVWMYFVLPAPLKFEGGFGIYTYNQDLNADATNYSHAFSSTVQPVIKQNHITTVVFGDSETKGYNGDIYKWKK